MKLKKFHEPNREDNGLSLNVSKSKKKKEKEFKGKKTNQYSSDGLTKVECYNYQKKG